VYSELTIEGGYGPSMSIPICTTFYNSDRKRAVANASGTRERPIDKL